MPLGHLSAIIMNLYIPCPHSYFKMTLSFNIHGCDTPSMISWLYAGTCTFILLNLIVTQQSGKTPLHHAARSGNADMVNALLKAGSKVDEKDEVSMLRK